ncbi:hypothetical protein [Tannockella kyphosi]|uniref:hypothetical protein n=1 Tax=Tannockella kyphosi TaxID=2899121 RepID=UPI0020123048|nr:hypothetical protein [Tannockella kyphosi]
MKIKLLNKWKFFSFEHFKTTIKGYGYEYSFKKFIIQLFVFYLIIALIAMCFKLTWECHLVILLGTVISFPFIVIAQFRFLYQNKRFEYVVGYLEQMIFAFKKTPKILDCLRTVEELIDPSIQNIIREAILIIEEDVSGLGYQDAFLHIESSFPSSRVQAMHSFFLSVEKNGGKYQYAIDVLLDDIHKWVSRTYRYQKELQSLKMKIILSIFLSFMVAGTMTLMVPSELVVLNENIGYLVSTTILFLALIFMMAIVFSKLHGNWLVNDQNDDSFEMQRVESFIQKFTIKSSLKRIFVQACFVIPLLIYGIFQQKVIYFILSLLMIIVLFFLEFFKQHERKRKVYRNIQKTFPLWLRDISLQIQTLVVPLALQESINEAPYILRNPLRNLVQDIQQTPDSIQPYREFLIEYQIPDIQNAMSMLYSIQSLPMREIQIQITALIKRNQEMLEKAETMKNEDRLAGVAFIMAIPMLLATFKLMIDLVIILLSFMSLTSVA